MQIKLNNFIPSPLSENYSVNSDLWGKPNLLLNELETTMILSASGRGKTSLISMIYGTRNDYIGSLFISGQNVEAFSAKKWSNLRANKLSIVFQSLKLFPELSALDNVNIKNQLTNYKSQAEIEYLFEQLGMTAHKNQLVSHLSFGQQQRIAIIRALCQPFETILLDEPFSHLDKNNAQIAWNLIKTESQKQKAGIIITGLENEVFIHAAKTHTI